MKMTPRKSKHWQIAAKKITNVITFGCCSQNAQKHFKYLSTNLLYSMLNGVLYTTRTTLSPTNMRVLSPTLIHLLLYMTGLWSKLSSSIFTLYPQLSILLVILSLSGVKRTRKCLTLENKLLTSSFTERNHLSGLL